MRDIVVALSLAAGIPICFFSPGIGAVLWGWLGFLYPTRVTEGLVLGIPFAWLVVIAALAGVARLRSRPELPRSREMVLLVALWIF